MLQENSFLNVRFHTTMATAATFENKRQTIVSSTANFFIPLGPDTTFQAIDMQMNFVLVGCCASNMLWLDLRPVQTLATLLAPTCCERLVGSCWMKFETGQTSEPTSANISIVSRSSKRGPTILRSFAQHSIHANKKSTWRRRWKTSQSPLYSHLMTQLVVTCCERLHTSANIAQQETTLLGPTMLHVVASVCTGFY